MVRPFPLHHQVCIRHLTGSGAILIGTAVVSPTAVLFCVVGARPYNSPIQVGQGRGGLARTPTAAAGNCY